MIQLSVVSEERRREFARSPEPGLVCIIEDDPTVRRIIEFGASRKNLVSAECRSIEELVLRTAVQKPSHIFIGVNAANCDAVEAIRHLEKARYQGIVHLMSGGDIDLLESLREIGIARGLSMGCRLQKPFRRSTIETIFDERRCTVPLEEIGVAAPPLSPVDRGSSIGAAIASGAVEIIYQPRFDLETGRPFGAEVSARHAGSHEPLLSSDGAAQDVDRLSEIMLTSALSAWRRFARPAFHPVIKLRVPVSSLSRLPLGEIIRRDRPQFSEWPGIVIEFTEADVGSDPSKIREIAAQLKIYGLSVSFGDLGAGRTALRVLEPILPAEISINRIFVAGCAHRQFSREVCKSMIFLAENLGARSVAEGIQSQEDVSALVEIGCNSGQGNILAPAVLADDFERFIARGESLTLPERRPSRLFHLRTDSRLTLREIEVLELIAAGRSSKEAGQTLGLSPRTIDVYRAKLMAKLNARNVAELVKVALTARH